MNYVRLKRRADFGQVFKRGRTYGDRYLVLFVLHPGPAPNTRVGFTTQRSVGTAVKRNRVRRRLRALYSAYADAVDGCGDLIFVGKKSMIDAPWDQLQRSIARVLRQAGCLK
ncbi:MAG: ribonuclease P protein component [Thermaerobacter sp.]|nr:ribonuclease P protein component [Thermaerobacter sp.]